MKTLGYLLEKEFRQIFRDSILLRLIMVIPLVQLLILPLVADYETKNILIAIVDADRSPWSGRLVSSITGSGYFRLAAMCESFGQAMALVEADRADLVLEIPVGFEAQLHRESQAELLVAVNAINGMKATMGSAYLSRIIGSFNAGLRAAQMPGATELPYPVLEVASANWFNRFLNYQHFMVPGILAMLVTMISTYMCALNIVKEKEKGTIEQINVTPIPRHLFIMGKLIPFLLIGLWVFSLGLFAVARLVYQIVPAGSLWVLYGFLVLYLIAVLGLGLLISTYAQTQQQAMSLAFFIMMIFLLMSGLFTPIESMPTWARWLARLNPLTYFIEVVRMIVMKGSGIAHVRWHFLAMLGFAMFFNGWAILHYKKTN